MRSSEYLLVWKEISNRFKDIGMVAPSSRFFSRDMADKVGTSDSPQRILEVGPGTGPITRAILGKMREEDHLTVCEKNTAFLQKLKNGLSSEESYKKHQDRVEFFDGAVNEFADSSSLPKFDVIISSLPFNNFPVSLVDECLEAYESMCAPGGSVSLCEYLGVRPFGLLFFGSEKREQLKEVDTTLEKWYSEVPGKRKISKKITFLNIPPAVTVRFHYEE